MLLPKQLRHEVQAVYVADPISCRGIFQLFATRALTAGAFCLQVFKYIGLDPFVMPDDFPEISGDLSP